MNGKAAVIGTFDRVAIFASLGVPLQYHCVKYCAEYVRINRKRDVECSDVCRHISTVALKEFIDKALQKKDKQVETLSTLVFFLDTVVVDPDLGIDKALMRHQKGKDSVQCSRRELFTHILKNLVLKAKQRDTNSSLVQELKLLNVPEECGYADSESTQKCLNAVNERYVAFVPGVITRASSDTLITFRIDEAYPIIVGTITAYTLDKLLRISSANDDSLAIVVDTTHGVNYFTLALKDGIQLAAELYAYASLLRGKPRRIVIYHYNSDPIRAPNQSNIVLSAKFHLLNEIPVTIPADDRQSFMVVSRYVPLLIEQAISSAQDIETLVNRLVSRSSSLLECLQNNVNDVWRGVVYSALLFSRNLFLWALRQAHDISLCSTSAGSSAGENNPINRVRAVLSHIISAIEKMKIEIKWETEGRGGIGITECKVNYNIEKNAPDVLAVTLLTLGVVLKSYAEYASRDVYKDVYNVIASAQSGCVKDGEVLSFIQSLKLAKKEESNSGSNSNTYVCFDAGKVLSIARRLYPQQDIVILEHEIENLGSIMKIAEGETEKGTDETKTKSSTGKRIIIAKLCNNAYVVKPRSEGVDKVDERNMYAHAGLARGLPWFAVVEPNKNKTVICLGDPQKVINIVIASAKASRQEIT